MKSTTKSVIVFAGLLLLTSVIGCSVNANKGSDDKSGKKVDIESPLGSLHVATNEKAKEADTGIALYPGARPAPEEKGDSDSQAANVSMGFAGFGLKVVARKYETDDSPDKLLGFYRKELAKFGKVVECRGDLDVESGKGKKGISCKPSSRDKTEIGVQEGDVNHIVSVEPREKGTHFALIYLRLQGRDKETM